MPNLVGIGLSQVPTNSMLGGLAYQDPEHASIKDLDLKNLSQINSEIADTAVDVFVYDTRKDSDGGAWRKRTQNTSWYNETLGTSVRGTRKEFPAVAVIVAESSKVTIYDGDDPDLPMWMVFNGGQSTFGFIGYDSNNRPCSSVSCLNGVMVVGSNGNGYAVATKFISDDGYFYNSTVNNGGVPIITNISNRHISTLVVGPSDGMGIINPIVNDVAMTVLPNAPIDDTTGLPVPTIAVATNGGISVIRDDGTVVDVLNDSGSSYDNSNFISFNSNNQLVFDFDNAKRIIRTLDIPTSDYTISQWSVGSDTGATIVGNTWIGSSNALAAPDIDRFQGLTTLPNGGVARSDTGILIWDENKNNPDTESLGCYISSSYNTGWMHGDIKGAFLSDTDTTNLSGGNKVTNGDSWSGAQSSQSSTAPTGWTGGNGATWKTETGNGANGTYIRLYNENNGGAGPNSYMYQAITTVAGKKYKISLTQIHHATISVYFYAGTTAGGNQLLSRSFNSSSSNTPRYLHDTFTATGTTTYITLGIISGTHNYGVGWDDVMVTEVDEDRSVNANGFHSFGTITKSAVATGAELVKYGGFSGSNGLAQPYNSDMDWGTGDFYYMVWVYHRDHNGLHGIISRQTDGQSSGNRFQFQSDNDGKYDIYSGGSPSVQNNLGSAKLNVWSQLALVRSGSTVTFYQDGISIRSWTDTANYTNSGANLRIGGLSLGSSIADNSYPADGVDFALFRAGGSAPSPEQIKKMYEDEKVLFQENAKATLYGSSDAVTALAFDDTTNLLHVGTSAGRSDFQGLRRINNTTTAVTTAMSASNGLVAEQ